MNEKRGHKFEEEWGNGRREGLEGERGEEKHCN